MSATAVLIWALTVRRPNEPAPNSLDDTHILELYTTEKSCREDLDDFEASGVGPHFACVSIEVAKASIHEEGHRKSKN